MAAKPGASEKFHICDIKERGYELDVRWLKDDSMDDSDDGALADPLAS